MESTPLIYPTQCVNSGPVIGLRQRRDFTCEKSGIDKAYKAHLRLNLSKLLLSRKLGLGA